MLGSIKGARVAAVQAVHRKESPAAFPAVDEVVRQAKSVLGDALVGIVVFGSWARGELAPSSDIDLLIVAAARVPIRRELYRRWDEHPISWQRHPIEPHFVHLPDATRSPSGLWAEVAMDGRVLVDAEAQVSAYLAVVRQAVALGQLRRETVHGHGYWVGSKVA